MEVSGQPQPRAPPPPRQEVKSPIKRKLGESQNRRGSFGADKNLLHFSSIKPRSLVVHLVA
jgi:hypothetical protein